MQTKRCGGTIVVVAGLAVLLGGCVETPPEPTRPAIAAATVVAAATIKAGGKPGGPPPGIDGSPGAQLFNAQGCQACHTIKGQGGTIGPDLSTIGTTAATRKPGLDAAAYIRESIVNPGALVVEGFQPGLMPATFGTALTPDQLDQLVSYLLEQQ